MFKQDLEHAPIYREIKELGEGAFGKVVLVKDEGGDRFLARKTVSDIIDILIGIRESDLLTRLGEVFSTSTPSIVGMRDFRLYTEDEKYHAELYLDYCSGGSLESALENESKTPDRPPSILLGGVGDRLKKLGLVIHTLAFLQNMGVYHMDIKTENLLIHKGNFVLCDFSNYFRDSPWKTGLYPPVTPQEATFYRPPEVACGRVSRDSIPKADVWALGVLILELMGCWETVDRMDFRVNDRIQKMTSLVQRIKVCQTTLQKRAKRGSAKIRFEIPSRLLFHRLYPSEFSETFGSEFENTKSPENEMIWCLMFAREIRDLDFQQLFQDSLEYFRIRNSQIPEEEITMLETLFKNVLPNLLKPRLSERWGMREVSRMFEERMGVANPLKIQTEDSEEIMDIGLWDRIPDPLWKRVVLRFRESTEDLKIHYGNISMDYPIQHLVYTKHLAERVMEKMIVGVEDQNLIPKDSDERTLFYEKMLSACIFPASEILDFIFPYQRCRWFEGRELNTLTPYLEMCCKLLIGEIAFSRPSREELEVLKGETNL